MEVEQTFSSMEDVVQHVDRKGAWQNWTMAKCCILVAGVSVVVYGQSIFFTGSFLHECELYEDGNDATSAFNLFINTTSNTENVTRSSIACALPSGAKCTKWNYSSPYYDFTMMNEFNLVCNNGVWLPTFQSAIVWAQLIGLPLWGIVADRFGRLSALRFTYILFLFTALAMTLVRSLFWMIALRAFIGFVLCAAWNACFVISMELAMPERRNSVGILVGAGWPVGSLLAAILAFFFRNYRHLSAATLVVATLCAPVLFIMEESPRWMVMHKRFRKAKELLQGHVKHPDDALPKGTDFLQNIYAERMNQDHAENKQSQARQLTRLLTKRRLRWRTLTLIFVWISVAFVFNGIMFYGTGSLPFSPMITLGVLSIIRMFGQPLYVCLCNIFGVRNAMIYALAVTAVSMLCLGFIPLHRSLFLSVTYALLFIVGCIAIDMDLCVIYIVTGELYPTVLRQSSIGFFSMAGRLGSMAAPYVATLFAQYWLPLPAFIFGAVCVVSTLISLGLPRADALLPETISEAELIEDAEQVIPLKSKDNIRR